MINGAHAVIYSKDPKADRAFFKDVLNLPYVDVGHDWLIFGLPPSEIAVHPSEKNDIQGIYLMCEDIDVLAASLQKQGIACSDIQDQGWGRLCQITLPGGGTLDIYEPRHGRPENPV